MYDFEIPSFDGKMQGGPPQRGAPVSEGQDGVCNRPGVQE